MKEITVRSFAKINLSLDVGACDAQGYHEVDMIMQQLAFHDDVQLRFVRFPGGKKGDIGISVRTNRYYLPTDRRNLAWRAAELMIDRYGSSWESGRLEINILKRIPVAAGLAGGSGNGAAVIHGMNVMFGLKLTLGEICSLCEELGSDVPFSAVGQARGNKGFPTAVRRDSMAASCVRATGRGTVLEPLRGIDRPIVIAKPALSVSTAEVYRGIDNCDIPERPDNRRLARRLEENVVGDGRVYEDFINVLENYTLAAYPKVAELKERMERMHPEKALMSGSGPTVFAVFRRMEDAQKSCRILRKQGYEAYWTRTMK